MMTTARRKELVKKYQSREELNRQHEELAQEIAKNEKMLPMLVKRTYFMRHGFEDARTDEMLTRLEALAEALHETTVAERELHDTPVAWIEEAIAPIKRERWGVHKDAEKLKQRRETVWAMIQNEEPARNPKKALVDRLIKREKPRRSPAQLEMDRIQKKLRECEDRERELCGQIAALANRKLELDPQPV